MLNRMLVMVALAGLSSCSASMEAPRVVRDMSKSSELGVFMKTHVNPAFSKISFLLFHEGEGDAEVEASQLPASASALANAADQLTRWQALPGESPESRLVFFEYAESLKKDANNLIAALAGGQRDVAVKVFESLRKKCDSCHHFFRYDESSSRDPHGAGGGR